MNRRKVRLAARKKRLEAGRTRDARAHANRTAGAASSPAPVEAVPAVLAVEAAAASSAPARDASSPVLDLAGFLDAVTSPEGLRMLGQHFGLKLPAAAFGVLAAELAQVAQAWGARGGLPAPVGAAPADVSPSTSRDAAPVPEASLLEQRDGPSVPTLDASPGARGDVAPADASPGAPRDAAAVVASPAAASEAAQPQPQPQPNGGTPCVSS